jgi:hypothetical protein
MPLLSQRWIGEQRRASWFRRQGRLPPVGEAVWQMPEDRLSGFITLLDPLFSAAHKLPFANFDRCSSAVGSSRTRTRMLRATFFVSHDAAWISGLISDGLTA